MVEPFENQVSSWPECLEVGRNLVRIKDSEVLVWVVNVSNQPLYMEQNMVHGSCEEVFYGSLPSPTHNLDSHCTLDSTGYRLYRH